MERDRQNRNSFPPTRMSLNSSFYKWAWGVVEGCKNDCEYCYARVEIERRGDNFSVPYFREDKLMEPFLVRPSRIFVNHLGDIAYTKVTDMERILDVCEELPEHEFIFMTKRPNVYFMYDFPDNCILGVTIEKPEYWWRAESVKKFKRTMCSVEPILGDFTGIDFSQFEFVVVGALIGSTGQEFYDTVIHDKIYYTR